MNALDVIMIAAVVIAAFWTVTTTRILRAGIGLAVTSALLAIVLFRLGARMAALFELSVCAGLIPVIFITTISFTRRMRPEDVSRARREGLRRYWYLPFFMGLAAIPIALTVPGFDFPLPVQAAAADVRSVLWGVRHLDLLGQLAVLLAGAFAVVVFFKESRS